MGVCTDGCPAMIGSRSGFISRIKQKSPNAIGSHCVIHHEALPASTLSAAVDMSLTVTHKHEMWIWFTLSFKMMKALLRLAAVWDKKDSWDLRGDTVQFIASSSALVLMTQNGNIYRPLTQTATFPLPRYRSKHITENSQSISQTTNSLTALLAKREQVRFREVVNTCTERRVEKRIQRTALILSHVLHTTLCEHVNGLCPAGLLNEQSITKHWFQSGRTCPI